MPFELGLTGLGLLDYDLPADRGLVVIPDGERPMDGKAGDLDRGSKNTGSGRAESLHLGSSRD
jgi:hypothetical protein